MKFYRFLMWLFRFRPVGYEQIPVKKCVILMAPHTSIIDFFYGMICIRWLRLKMAMVMKKEFFVFPIKGFLKRIGCVPVDRKHATNFVSYAVDLINSRDEVAFLICPEGTRKRVETWKKGFYYIALGAGVPIFCSHIDYVSRTMGVGKIFYPTGDYDKDIEEILQYYYGMKGWNKGKFNLEDKPYAHPEWLKKK